MKPLRICVVGAGQFSQAFTPLLQLHPLVTEVSLCDVLPERLQERARFQEVTRTFSSFEDALRSDVDAVMIFTQRWLHAPMAIQALRAGKHVYSAVPAAVTLEELHGLVEEVKRTGLVYMLGETSMYYGSFLFCREKWREGAFGHFVYGEGEYLHDMSHGFYTAFQNSGGTDWKRTASFPPMLYPTHSVSMILGLTGARMTSVSCLGWQDRSDDGIFQRDVSQWGNVFSNQTALFRTSDGGMARINEFRRVGQRGGRSVRLSIHGTEGSFEEQSNGAVWASRVDAPVDIEAQVNCPDKHTHKLWREMKVDPELRRDFISVFAEVHQKYRARLPESFRDGPNGHEGSHQFLVDDFVTAAARGSRPAISVWDAARFNAPGIVAHESAQREGETMQVPDFGSPPV